MRHQIIVDSMCSFLDKDNLEGAKATRDFYKKIAKYYPELEYDIPPTPVFLFENKSYSIKYFTFGAIEMLIQRLNLRELKKIFFYVALREDWIGACFITNDGGAI